MKIADTAIKRPVFVGMIVMAMIILGILGYRSMAVELMPNVDFPVIGVTSIYPGASASDMETLFTKPLEDALGTVEGLDGLASTSREGFSIVVLQFKMETDLKFAELKVREKVQAAAFDLPQDAQEPKVQRFSTEDTPVMFVSLTGDLSPPEFNDLFELTIKPQIENLPGIGSVVLNGARKKQIEVIINRSLLQANGLAYNQLAAAIQRRNISIPAGSIREEARTTTIRVTGKTSNLEELAGITLTTLNGKNIRLSDVATIREGLAEETTRARVNGQKALLFSIFKQSGSNMLEIAKAVRARIAEVQPSLPAGVGLAVVSDNSTLIQRSIQGVQDDILIGILLAVLIVWLFLGNFRSTLITAIALPNSLLGAFFLLNLAGFSINTVTLMALSLAVGLLIDDSIVVRENIFRRIEHGEDPKTAARLGTAEVGLAVISTTLSIMAVFIPISFMSGIVGKFFKEFGLTVAFALAISLVDAFTTAPMLSAYWYKDSRQAKSALAKFLNKLSAAWEVAFAKLGHTYRGILAWSLDHKKSVVFGTLGLMVVSVLSLGYVGQNFISPVDAGSFNITLETYPGAPLDEIEKAVVKTEEFIKGLEGVETFYSVMGQGGSQRAQITVDLVALSHRHVSTRELLERTRAFVNAQFASSLNILLAEKSAVASIMGTGSTTGDAGGGGIVIALKGPELSTLESLSRAVSNVAASVPGTSDISLSFKPGTPEVVLRLDPIKAEQAGLTPIELGGILRDLVSGAKVSTLSLNGRDYNILVKLDPLDLRNKEDLRNLLITTRSGKKIPLGAVCILEDGSSPIQIQRDNRQRVVYVFVGLKAGFTLGETTAKISKALEAQITRPAGYTWDFGGQQKYFAELGLQMGLAMLLAVLFMFMILASLYNSVVQPLYVMLSLPLAFIGSFFMLFTTGVNLDIYGYIGLIMVLGLVAKNAILLLDFTNKKREEGQDIRQALLTSGPLRLRPILMTSFAIIFGMLPLALGLNEGSSGRQALPMAVIGGILTSTFLTLVVVPVVYEAVEKRLQRRKEKKAAQS